MRTGIRVLIVALAATALVYSGLNQASGAPVAPVRGGTINIAQATDATILDMHLYTDGATANMLDHMFERLFHFAPEGGIVPVLATGFSASPDRRTWTVKLRSGVRFHDGTPFNAEAAKFNLDRVLDPANRSPWRFLISNITQVNVVDDTTIQLVTGTPFAPLISHLSHSGIGMQSPTAIRRLGADYVRSPVGTGPFRFKEWVRGDRLVMSRNDDYWGERAFLDEVVFRVIPDDGARVLAMEAGSVHVAVRTPPREIERLARIPAVRVDLSPSVRTVYVAFNTQRPPFNDRRVRHAFNYAISKTAIARGVLFNTARVSDAPIAPNIQGYHPIMTYEADMDRARSLLAEAGHGRGLTVTFHHPTGADLRDAEIAAGMQALLRRIGVEARLVTMEWGAYLATLRGPRAIEDLQMSWLSWGTITGDADYGLYPLFHSSQFPPQFNTAFYKNARVDALLDEGRSTIDQAVRNRVYREAMRIIMEDAPWLFMYGESQVTGIRAEVQGLVVHPIGRQMAHRAWIRR